MNIDERTFQALMARLAYLENRYSRTEVIETGREVLTAARTYYVRTDGSDSNNGLANTATGAFLTIQKAIDVVANGLDLGGFNVTIQVAAGTYTGTVRVTAPWVGVGTVTLTGDTTTPTNVVISTTTGGNVVSVSFGALTIGGFSITTTSPGSNALNAVNFGTITVNGSMNYGAVTASHLLADRQGSITHSSIAYTISGNATVAHARVQQSGAIILNASTATLTASITVGNAFIVAITTGSVRASGWSAVLGAFTVTGTRYNATLNGVIDTNGGGAGFFPGTVAGTTATGGQYN